MEARVFVGNLAYLATDMRLQKLFERHGTVVSAKAISDRVTGRSKGFGFVEMSSEEEAYKTMKL